VINATFPQNGVCGKNTRPQDLYRSSDFTGTIRA
jgi:hypothetical protein